MTVPSRIRAAVVTLTDLLDTGPDDNSSRKKEEGSQGGLSAPVNIYGINGRWGEEPRQQDAALRLSGLP